MSKEQEIISRLSKTVIILAKIAARTDDAFVIRKIYKYLMSLLQNFIFLGKGEQNDHVAQYRTFQFALDSITEFLDYLEHHEMAPAIPLLRARKSLLELKLSAAKVRPRRTPAAEAPPDKMPEQKTLTRHAPIPRHIPSYRENVSDLGANKERIFRFIQQSPNARTKDIIEEFRLLSERTVKRNLKELIEGGFIQKKAEHKAVYYQAIEIH